MAASTSKSSSSRSPSSCATRSKAPKMSQPSQESMLTAVKNLKKGAFWLSLMTTLMTTPAHRNFRVQKKSASEFRTASKIRTGGRGPKRAPNLRSAEGHYDIVYVHQGAVKNGILRLPDVHSHVRKPRRACAWRSRAIRDEQIRSRSRSCIS